MPNNRTYWAIVAAGFSKLGETTYTEAHGCQSCGFNVNFDLEEFFELGQIAIYENTENIPEVEVTIDKVLDGYPLLYHLATNGATGNTISARQNARTTMAYSIFGDTQDSASGVPVVECEVSGLYWSSLNYEFNVEGAFTESLTLVGNNINWKSSSFNFSGSIFDNTDIPLATTSGYGGIQRRQNLVFDSAGGGLDVNNQADVTDATILPPDIPGISSSGTNDKTAGVFGAHIQRISTSVDLGRDQIFELGRRGPYFRYATFPTEVRTEIEVLTTQGAGKNADENSEANLTNRTIKIKTQEGTFINLGTKNKLASYSVTGADTGGANQTVTYSYTNFNDMSISHPQQPS